LLVGLVYIFLGYSLFRWFEFQANRRGILEAILIRARYPEATGLSDLD